MAIAWIVTTTNPHLIEAFRRGQWEVKSFSPSEFVPASIARVCKLDAIVFEMADAMSVDTCREICDKRIAPTLAIVANLAYAQAALEAGADDFLVAPVDPIEALLRVRKLARTSNVVRVGDLEIDLAARQVSYDGRLVQLSRLEFRLLACLAKRAGHMVSHAMILEDVWGREADHWTLAQVKSSVGRVRTKIEPDLHNPQYIISIRGEGYRLRNQRQWEEDRHSLGGQT